MACTVPFAQAQPTSPTDSNSSAASKYNITRPYDCYKCLNNSDARFCELNNKTECCLSSSTSTICSEGSCINPYKTTAKETWKSEKNNSYQIASKFDNRLNYFKCIKYDDNPCKETKIKVPSIGHFNIIDLKKHWSSVCYWKVYLYKQNYQTIQF